MSLLNLILVRHGETQWSRTGRLTSRTDLPLTSVGRAEAQSAGAMIAALVGPDAGLQVFTSPLARARDSAALGGLATTPDVHEGLVEADFGSYEGLTRAEIQATRPGWDYWRDGCPDGEALDAVGRRLRLVLDARRADARTLVVFGHGVAHRTMLFDLLGLPRAAADAVRLETGSVLWLTVDAGGQFRLQIPNAITLCLDSPRGRR